MSNGSKTPEQIEKAHQEMDREPQQSIQSLLDSRVVILGLGLGLTLTAGKQMDQLGTALGNTVSNKLAPVTKPHWGPIKRDTLHKMSNLILLDLLIGAFYDSRVLF